MRGHKKTFLIFGILFLAIAGLSFGYGFLHLKTAKTYEEIKKLKEKIAEEKVKDRQFSLIKSDIKNTLADYEKIEKLFVGREGLVDFIQNLEDLGKSAKVLVLTKGVTSKSLSPDLGIEEEKDFLKEEITVNLDVYGSLETNTAFLNLIEHLPYKTNVSAISFEKLGEKNVNKDVPEKNSFTFKSNITMTVLKLK